MQRKALVVAAGAAVLAIVGVAVLVRDTKRPIPKVKTPPSGEISVAYPEEPKSLNPYVFEGDTNATRDLLRPVLPTLQSITPGLRYVPSLATSVSKDMDVRLDPRAVWSDGQPITSADVRFTWETIRDARWPIADRSAYKHVTDVVIQNPKRFRLVLDAKFLGSKDLFSAGDFILPKHLLEETDFGQQMRSSVSFSGGPYMLESYTQGLEVVYAANPKWWGTGPAIAKVHVLFVPDIATALQLLERKSVDALASTTQLNLAARLSRIDGVTAKKRYGACWWELGFNLDRPLVRDLAFRQFVARATDRLGFVEALIRREGRVLDHLAPSRNLGSAFSVYRKESKPYKGKKAEIGVSTSSTNEMGLLLERLVQKGMLDAGFRFDLRNTEADRFYGEWRHQGRFDLAVWERRGTPARVLSGEYRSDLKPPAGSNYTRLASPEVDAALSAADDVLMTQLASTLPALPLFECQAYLGFRGLSGPDPNATSDGPFWNLENWRTR